MDLPADCNSPEEARRIVEQIAAEKRSEAAAGGDDFRGLLKRIVGIWSDPTHAIIELLQNADDAGATEAYCKVTEDGVLFCHDGGRFSPKDVYAVSSVDKSTKDPNTHTGFMGIGFKAVFKLSHRPIVSSPPWRFGFWPDEEGSPDWGWIRIPRWVGTQPIAVAKADKFHNQFWLPFRSDLSATARSHVANDILQKFDNVCFLFLRDTRSFEVELADGRFRKMKRDGDRVVEEDNEGKRVHAFRVFRKHFKVDPAATEDLAIQSTERHRAKTREVLLAFQLDEDGQLFEAEDAALYNFLPTEYLPGLSFFVQADFVLNTSRSSLDEDLAWNQWMWRSAGDLFSDALTAFQQDPVNRTRFLNLVPRQSNRALVQIQFVAPLLTGLEKKKIVPTSTREWAMPTEVVIADPETVELVDFEKLQGLTGRSKFADPEVSNAADLLVKLGAIKRGDDLVLEALGDKTWLAAKSPAWFQKLYDFLWERFFGANPSRRWSFSDRETLKSRAIVQGPDGKPKRADEILFPPADKTVAARYLEVPDVNLVPPEHLGNRSKQLLEELGVKPFSGRNVIENSVLQHFETNAWQDWTPEDLAKRLALLRLWLKDEQWLPPANLRYNLGNVRVQTTTGSRERAEDCYFPTPQLRLLLPNAAFCAPIESDPDQERFLRALGISDIPRVIVGNQGRNWQNVTSPPVNFAPLWRKYWAWLSISSALHLGNKNQHISEISAIEGWEEIEWDAAKGDTMWHLLAANWQKEYSPNVKSIYHYWLNRMWNDRSVDSYLAWQLKTANWVPTTSGPLAPDSGIFLPTPRLVKLGRGHVPFLEMAHENVKDFSSENRGFLEFLGISTEPNLDAVFQILDLVQEKPAAETDKVQLAAIYRELVRALEDGETLPSIKLLAEKGEFEAPSSLLWKDDPELAEQLKDAEGVLFAWHPIGVAGLSRLFTAAGVNPLSEQVKKSFLTPDVAALDEATTADFRSKSRLIYSLLSHHKSSELAASAKALGHLEVFATDEQLAVRLEIGGQEVIMASLAHYDSKTNRLYRSPQSTHYDLALALCAAFGMDVEHASMLEVVLEKPLAKVESRFSRQRIALLEVEVEDFVPTGPLGPIMRKPEPPAAPQEENIGTIELERLPSPQPPGPHPPGIKETPPDGRPGEPPPGQKPHPPAVPKPPRGHIEHSEQIEEENAQLVISFENKQGRDAVDRRKEQGLGYDLESTDRVTGEKRYIELKGHSHVELTPNEHRRALDLGPSYFLYVVGGDLLSVIRDPCRACQVKETPRIEIRYAMVNWAQVGERFKVHRVSR